MTFLNRVTRIFRQHDHNAIRRIMAPSQKYTLLEKTERIPIAKYPKDKWVFPDNTATFTFVKVGKKQDPNYFDEITSFFDKNGKLIRRCRKGSDINNKISDYQYDFFCIRNEKAYKSHKIYGDDTRRVTTKEFIPDPDCDVGVGIGTWRTTSDDFFSISNVWGESVLDILNRKKKVTRIKNNFNPNNQDLMTAEITEYPLTRSRESKKVLSLDLKIEKEIPEIVGINKTTNVQVPLNDTFLPFRLYVDREAQQIALTRHFLRSKGLDDLSVNIYTNSKSVAQNASAHFSPHTSSGEICYKYVPRYEQNIDTIAHEVEHAYQHSLIGRAGLAKSKYEQNCKYILPEIRTEAMRKEALEYAKADDIYPNTYKIERLRECPEYWENLLEVKARDAGRLAKAEYFAKQKSLTDQFKFLPNCNIL